MIMKPVQEVEDAEEAQSIAIAWQHWASEQSMSWGEVADWGAYFTALAERFHLEEEFKENGI